MSDLLERQGHKVFTPTLTGLGERSHLLRAGINVSTHVTDVVNVLKWEGLSNVVLCGHSYGGLVVSGVAEKSHSAIGSIVFLDAFVPENGDSMAGLTSQAVRDNLKIAAERGDLGVPARSAAAFLVNEKDQAWVDAMCVPQPIGTMTEKMTLTGAREKIGKKAYIRAVAYPNPGFDAAYARVKSRQVVAHLRGAVRARRDGRHAGAAGGDFAGGGVGFWPHPEERPKAASRRMGHRPGLAAHPSRRIASRCSSG